MANTFLDEENDDSVVATSTYLVLQATPDLPLQPIITGTYVDTFVRTTGTERWRFAERRFSVGRIGNLSQHLTISLEDR